MKEFLIKVIMFSIAILLFKTFGYFSGVSLETFLISYLVWIEIEKIVEKETK